MKTEDIKILSTVQILGEQIKDLVTHIDNVQDENNLLKHKLRTYKNIIKLNRYLLIINGILGAYTMTHILS